MATTLYTLTASAQVVAPTSVVSHISCTTSFLYGFGASEPTVWHEHLYQQIFTDSHINYDGSFGQMWAKIRSEPCQLITTTA